MNPPRTQDKSKKAPNKRDAAKNKLEPRPGFVKQWKKLSFNQKAVITIAAFVALATAIPAVIALMNFFKADEPRIEIEKAFMSYAPVGGRRLEARLQLHNASKAQAVGMKVDIAIEGRAQGLPPVVQRENAPGSIVDVAPDGRVIVPVPGKMPGIRPDSADAIQAGRVRVYVSGFIDYADTAGHPYTTEFCGYYDPTMDSVEPLVLLHCSDHNHIGQRR